MMCVAKIKGAFGKQILDWSNMVLRHAQAAAAAIA